MTISKHELGVLSEADKLRFREMYDVNEVSGCWVWRFGKTKSGYGKFAFVRRLEAENQKVTKMAHHVAFNIAYGRWPAAGLLLMHSCDRTSCVNPAHLAEGTPKQNSEDMTRKGRQTRGEDLHTNKLTEPQVIEIRAKFDAGSSINDLGKEFGVTPGNIWFIGKRKSWKHLA